MMRIGWGLVWIVLAAGAGAQTDAPVVRIPGRVDTGRPRPAPPMPAVVAMENVMPGAPDGSPPPPPVAVPHAGPVVVPVGAIMAWARNMTNTPALPPGWMECNGQVVDDEGSPYFSQALPDLNSAEGDGGRFLRGGTRSGTIGGSITHHHGGYRSQKYGTQRSPVGSPVPAEHLPPFYTVVWIMRVR